MKINRNLISDQSTSVPAYISKLDSKRLELLNNRMTRSESTVVDQISSSSFSVEKPVELTAEKTEEVLKEIDPMEFLLDKYFTLLYSSSNMLEHFVKSSIPKMHLLRRDNVQLAKDCLVKLSVGSLNKFEKRHLLNINEKEPMSTILERWCDENSLILAESEFKYRLKRAEKLKISIKNHESLVKYFDMWKLKDLKLQILVTLELLKIINNEPKTAQKTAEKTNDANLESKSSKPQTHKLYSSNLIGRKRKNRKRLIPTSLGTVIPASLNFDTDLRNNRLFEDVIKENNMELNPSNLTNLVNIYFEKLCVYDAINGYDYKNINSSWGFLSNCVMPFYETHHKKLLSELAVKSRGPAFLLELKSRKERKAREQRRQLKQKEESLKVKPERKSTVLDLSEIRLKRSHSSFSAPKVDMSRKTFSMTVSNTFTESQSITRTNSINYSDPVLFSDASKSSESGLSTHELQSKKRKLLAPQKAKKVTTSDPLSKDNSTKVYEIFHHNQIIEATPMKPSKFYDPDIYNSGITSNAVKLGATENQIITSSPALRNFSPSKNRNRLGPSIVGTETQISETPQLERVQIRPGVFEIGSSPLKSAQKIAQNGFSLLADVTPVKSVPMIVESSPLFPNTAPIPASKSISRKLEFT